jgi:hypothetical protein
MTPPLPPHLRCNFLQPLSLLQLPLCPLSPLRLSVSLSLQTRSFLRARPLLRRPRLPLPRRTLGVVIPGAAEAKPHYIEILLRVLVNHAHHKTRLQGRGEGGQALEREAGAVG